MGLLLASARPAVKPCAFLLVRGWEERGDHGELLPGPLFPDQIRVLSTQLS